MDSRTLSKATGMPAGTLNAWIQRGYVPRMDVEVSGRRRDLDLPTAIYIAIMTELVRLGFGAPFASWITIQGSHHKRFVMARNATKPDANYPPEAVGTQTVRQAALYEIEGFESYATLPKALAKFSGGVPSGYVVIDVEQITAKMKQAETEWQQRRKTQANT
jgi:hypothetical protein